MSFLEIGLCHPRNSLNIIFRLNTLFLMSFPESSCPGNLPIRVQINQKYLRTFAVIFRARVWVFVYLTVSQKWLIRSYVASTLFIQESALCGSTTMLLIFILAHDAWCWAATECCTQALRGDQFETKVL